jgi:sodium/potassium-transporting ATPase subunit alpha
MTFSSILANMIGVVVAFIPEGLPLVLSIGLSIIANRLCHEHKVLVKRLGSIETLLASETGTLTQNLMTVNAVIIAANLASEQHSVGLRL